ncbi:HNH endonuclease [Shewanella corallii]|uniref:HNH endonuclease n=1 Tax=Shewanella corallii TaxID=560080 RepID=A0ABT0ND61_9GAMM|nr:HNH endonuclease signature motif containing protein [Shewanella corallii]MCL2916040.1 HNH endonuclease [Shewanella corallii]
MRVIAKPELDAKDVYELCISKVKNRDLKERFVQIAGSIAEAEQEYQEKAESKQWYLIESSDGVNGVVNKAEMEKVYTQRMVGKKAPGRALYDQLKNAAPNGICPLCGQRVVETLDHFLPKADFSSLVVVPLNLIPACSDCNKSKLDKAPDQICKQTLHPYYDDVTGEQWLFAEVKEETPGTIRFYTSYVEAYGDVLNERIKFHFKELGLGSLYMSNANSTVTEIQFRLSKTHEKGGKIAVKAYLKEEEESRRNNHVNSWNTAAYQAMMNSEWFCDGGFNEFK